MTPPNPNAPLACFICGKEKGQPPERCNGHYDNEPNSTPGFSTAQLKRFLDSPYQMLAGDVKVVIQMALRLPAAVKEIGRLRDALKQIAKPALGGKQQQWIAQRALDAAKEPAK